MTSNDFIQELAFDPRLIENLIMRLSVWFVLLVATFVVSSGSFVSAKADAVADYANRSTKARRLREQVAANVEKVIRDAEAFLIAHMVNQPLRGQVLEHIKAIQSELPSSRKTGVTLVHSKELMTQLETLLTSLSQLRPRNG